MEEAVVGFLLGGGMVIWGLKAYINHEHLIHTAVGGNLDGCDISHDARELRRLQDACVFTIESTMVDFLAGYLCRSYQSAVR